MKCDKWIIGIDGQKYAVDRTFSNEPAIYIRQNNGALNKHISDYIPEKEQSLVIVARLVKDDSK